MASPDDTTSPADVQPTFDLFTQPDSHIDYDALQTALAADIIAIDTETETKWPGFGPEKDFGLAYSAPVIVISAAWIDVSGELRTLAIYQKSGNWPEAVRDWLKQVYASKLVIFHNAVFDCRQLSKYTDGASPLRIWDTAANERLLNPAVRKFYSLEAVAKNYGVVVEAAQSVTKKKRGSLHLIERASLLDYAAADARVTYQVYQAQSRFKLDALGQELLDWENRMTRAYCQMAASGVRIDAEVVKARIVELGRVGAECAQRLAVDGLDKPNSPQARREYVWGTKALPQPNPKLREHEELFTEKGAFSAGADALEKYVEFFPEAAGILADLITWIDVDRMIATLSALIEHAATDGRVHSMISVGTETGRRASGHPNLQNLKMALKSEDDPAGTLAGVLVGDEGATLVEIDYSNAENWIAALLSGDNAFAAACSAEDFHSAMAAKYYGKTWEEADKTERKRLRKLGKAVTFGSAYGMGINLLSRRLNCTLEEADRILNAKDAAFPKVKHAKSEVEKKVKASGAVRLWTGRRVACDPRKPYVGWNYVCQGGVSELIKRAIVLITEEFGRLGLRSRVAIDMHDAVILSVRHEEWDEALRVASDIMESVMPATLNNRTTPPVKWIAQPDLEENKKKWGAGQFHPEPTPVPPPEQTKTVHISQGFDIYIGRDHDTLKDQGWGNPFVIGRDGTRVQVIEKYRASLLKNYALLCRVPELRGKRLGCFCKTASAPATPCHGDILAELANLTDAELAPLLEAAQTYRAEQWIIEFEEVGASIELPCEFAGSFEDYLLHADHPTQQALQGVFKRLHAFWVGQNAKTLWVCLPPALGGARVQLDWANYRKAIYQWKKIAEAGGDAKPFGGDVYPASELAEMFEYATAHIAFMKKRIEAIQHYLALLGSGQAVAA